LEPVPLGIGALMLKTREKLLRVLQEREFERVGGIVLVTVDLRMIAATTDNLRDEVAARRLCEVLYYRLNVMAIDVPPLRERMEDVPALVSHFLAGHHYGPVSAPARIAVEAMDKLLRHDWPGNMGELENTIMRAGPLTRRRHHLRPHRLRRLAPPPTASCWQAQRIRSATMPR